MGAPLGTAAARIAELAPHPLDQDRVAAAAGELLNRWFGGRGFAASCVPKPELRWTPHLFVRKSGARVVAFVDGIIRRLAVPGVEMPDCFSWITGDLPPPKPDEAPKAESDNAAGRQGVGSAAVPADRLESISFTRACGAEQLQIASLFERHAGLKVQGPPGTGKAHTIAKLIGHCLAKGWRVLMTSATSKALGEVRNQVALDLQPLCIPLLDCDSDSDSRELLQASLNAIASRSGTHEHDVLQCNIAGLTQLRHDLLGRLRELEQGLVTCRADETRAILVGNYEALSPAWRRISLRSASERR